MIKSRGWYLQYVQLPADGVVGLLKLLHTQRLQKALPGSVLLVCLQGLLAAASGGVDTSSLSKANWSAVPATLPVMSLAFVYQNVVPVIATSLEVRLLCGACLAMHGQHR